jgi:hypothetical protein
VEGPAVPQIFRGNVFRQSGPAVSFSPEAGSKNRRDLTALFKQRNLISSNRTLVKAINKLHRQKASPLANLDSSG